MFEKHLLVIRKRISYDFQNSLFVPSIKLLISTVIRKRELNMSIFRQCPKFFWSLANSPL